jgi:chaperonin GroES
MSIKPLADRIVIEPQAAETKTASGLYIPDSAKEKPQKGTVIAVGVGRVTDNGQTVAMELKEGDVVLYGKYAGTEVEVDGKSVVLMRESDVLGKF